MAPADHKPLAVTPFFTRLGQLFIEGRLREMSQFWSYPCPVEAGGRLTVIRSPESLMAFFAVRRTTALNLGMTAMVPRVAAVEMPRKGRFRVWLRWVHHFGDRIVEEEHGTLYYMSRKPWGGLSIEMMDIVQIPDAASEARSA